MKPSQVLTCLRTAVEAKIPIMLHGSPGIGKSQVVAQLALELKRPLIDIRLSQLDPVDLRGVPSVNAKTKRTSWNVPEFLPAVGSAYENAIIFLDEINSAAQATQAASYQLVLDRKLGNYELPPGVALIAAGNRAADRAIVNQMSSALRNRFMHVNFDLDLNDWCQWAFAKNISEEIIGFIRFRPSALNEIDTESKNKETQDKVKHALKQNAFSTPRSWEYADKILKSNPPKDMEHEMLSAVVGEVSASEFVGYMRYYRQMPNIDAILMNPEKEKIPDRLETLHAVTVGLSKRASMQNIERVVSYALRIPVEFQAMLMRDIASRDSKITQSKAFNRWASLRQDILG